METYNKQAGAIMRMAFVPCFLLLTIGYMWEHMTSAMAVTSVLSTIIVSSAFAWSTSIKHF